MVRERRATAVAVGAAAMLALGACEVVPPGAPDVSDHSLSGEWIGCLAGADGDVGRHMIFFPDSFRTTTRTYATADRTCGGAPTSEATEIWRYRIGREVPTTVGSEGGEVLAREMNIENSFETLFTLVYVDARSTPRLLYFGDLGEDPLQDGSAPERRPDVLSPATALVGQ